MQAPTAPTGPPDQQPGERACPSCGASNGLLAAFCWQCYRPFGAAAGPPTARAGAYAGPQAGRYPAPTSGLPAASVPEISRPAPARPLAGMVGVLALVLAVVVGVVLFVGRGSGVELPESFGGLSQIQGDQVDVVADAYHAQADVQGIQTDLALYGSGGMPAAALVWITGEGVSLTPSSRDAFAEFAGGFNSGLGAGTLDEGRTTTQTVGGVDYLCAPISGVPPGGVCMWQTDDVFWILVDMSGAPIDTTRSLAVAAHDAAA